MSGVRIIQPELPRNQILVGDALTSLRQLPSESVDCVVTSPPYYALRNYGEAEQLGLEASVEAYIDRLVAVCDEIGRMLKPTGTFWLNIADSYSRHQRAGAPPKSLLLVPERLALALSARGWIIRNRICWSKPNPMPSSVKDRLTCAHETVLLLTRSARYFFDLDAIRVPHTNDRRGLTRRGKSATTKSGPGKYESSDRSWAGPLAGNNSGLAKARSEGRPGHRLGKNPSDSWSIPTGNFAGAHFAPFPERLVERPIMAGCPARSCESCGVPWQQSQGVPEAPTCSCAADWQPGLVLDPFMGSGTTAVVATRLGRDWLGIELSSTYQHLALTRITNSVVRKGTNTRGGDALTTGASHDRSQRRAA